MPGENHQTKHNSEDLICCHMCRHFRFFENRAGHNSPHALGECKDRPWDGSRGQWAMFQHHCNAFEEASATDPHPHRPGMGVPQ